MKNLSLLLILFLCCSLGAEEKEPLRTFSPKGLVHALDTGDLEEARNIYRKSIIEGMNSFFLLNSYSNSRYGAKKVYEKDGLIVLKGNPWIRDGSSLVEALDGDSAVIRIHKKTMRIVYFEGDIVRNILLN